MGESIGNVSRGETYAGYTNLEIEVCTCGVLFAAPKNLLDNCRATGGSFYCPNGHSLVYKSENERLKRQLAMMKDEAAYQASRRDQVEASLRATKGVVTKQRRKLARVTAGVCPCCNRSFQNLARHMEGQHPDYKP